MVGGRTIHNETVRIWLTLRFQEALIQGFQQVEKFSYDNADLSALASLLAVPLQTQLARKGIAALNDEVDYLIEYPRQFDIPAAWKLANQMTFAIKFKIGTEIIKVIVTGKGKT